MFERRLKPKIAGIESAVISTKLTATDFFLLQEHISINIAIMFSNTAMIVERAANDIKMKKSVPQILPPFILLNKFGRVMKRSEGPESG